jgi:hypothetical protein
MVASARLDRKAKGAIVALLLVVTLIITLSIRSTIVAMTPEASVAAPIAEGEDELIQIAGHTLLLQHGSAGNRIAHWLKAGSNDSKAFEVGDQSFAAHSDVLTPEGERRAGIFARMMAQVRALKAQIFVSDKQTDAKLEEARAERLRSDLIAKGVQPTRVVLSDKAIEGGATLSRKPELVVVLSD